MPHMSMWVSVSDFQMYCRLIIFKKFLLFIILSRKFYKIVLLCGIICKMFDKISNKKDFLKFFNLYLYSALFWRKKTTSDITLRLFFSIYEMTFCQRVSTYRCYIPKQMTQQNCSYLRLLKKNTLTFYWRLQLDLIH